MAAAKKEMFAWMCKLERDFKSAHLAEKFGLTHRRAKRILQDFRDLGAVRNHGLANKSFWVVTNPNAVIYEDRQHPAQLAALARANAARMRAKQVAKEVLNWWPPKTELEKCWSGVTAAVDKECESDTIDSRVGEICPQE